MKKMMNRIKFLAVPALATLLLAGCSNSAAVSVNRVPSIVGVSDIQCLVNSTVDFLDGVAALDREDGDITPDMEITVTPEVAVVDGYAVFTQVGEYEVNYKVADSEGKVAEKSAFVDVIEREIYRDFSQPDGFTVQADGNATVEKSGMVNGVYTIKAAGGEIDEDIKLSRTYSLTTNVQYTFRYSIKSNFAGKIKVLADGDDCAELAVLEGENTIAFAHTVRSNGENKQDVRIDLCLGGLGEIEWEIYGVENEYPQEEGALAERIDNDFAFSGNSFERFDGTAGNVISDAESAKLEITQASEDVWRGGMFINTGVELDAGVNYTVSYDIQSENANHFEVVIQRGQWDEYKFDTAYFDNGAQEKISIEKTISVSNQSSGALWLYVQSGTALNKITISNLSVKERLGAFKREIFNLEDFTETHNADFYSVLTTDSGNIKYTIENFSATDYEHTINSPSFYIGGSAENYVITFKAKASKPIEMVLAAPVAGGWDPTLMWARLNLSEEERIYTFFCSGSSSDNYHKLVWQFGSVANQQYHNVEIEISDIKISLKNGELDD